MLRAQKHTRYTTSLRPELASPLRMVGPPKENNCPKFRGWMIAHCLGEDVDLIFHNSSVHSEVVHHVLIDDGCADDVLVSHVSNLLMSSSTFGFFKLLVDTSHLGQVTSQSKTICLVLGFASISVENRHLGITCCHLLLHQVYLFGLMFLEHSCFLWFELHVHGSNCHLSITVVVPECELLSEGSETSSNHF